MKVCADRPVLHCAFCAVFAVVAVTSDYFAQGSCARAEVSSASVVFVADCMEGVVGIGSGFYEYVADEAGVACGGFYVQSGEARQRLAVCGFVAVASQLVAAAYEQPYCAVCQSAFEGIGFGGHEVLGDIDLVVVLAAA